MSHPETARHPGDGPWEPEDPMSLQAENVAGDPDTMLACLVEEFARMGWDGPRIERLFEDPFFQATHGLRKRFGPDGTRRRIRVVLERCGVLRTRTVAQVDAAGDGEGGTLHV